MSFPLHYTLIQKNLRMVDIHHEYLDKIIAEYKSDMLGIGIKNPRLNLLILSIWFSTKYRSNDPSILYKLLGINIEREPLTLDGAWKSKLTRAFRRDRKRIL